ncbi:hypothetical protein D6D01_09700 [Aureobasidium pullulans]|uniref:BTB domain-containing protein n=1 Tax=Aureobasidium pullulans TaxID=5580 RepID=A0A4S9K024_AURPU|nr:hypothetical protein D6D01_09700 [Aureobasidium pullulans]
MSVWSSLTGPFCEITVGSGDAAVVFSLPKALLCNSSTYFKAAFNNGFSETSLQKINLDDDDPHIFRTYATWLFEREIANEAISNNSEAFCYELYIFADKRGIRGLANDSVTMIASYWTDTCVDFSLTKKYLPQLPSKSGLYNLVLDNMILNMRGWASDNFWNDTGFEEYSKEILVDLLKRESIYERDFSA